MEKKTLKKRNIFLLILLVLLSLSSALAVSTQSLAQSVVARDYFLTHKSIEPFYAQQKLDPTVLIHVREVVLKGREISAPKAGKVVLFLHGYSTPGHVAFDLNYRNCSIMRHFAYAGWDTFTMDYEGHGLSTRPLLMDAPQAFPQSKAPIHSDVAVNDVERVVSFIQALRGVKKIHVLGWSLGASRTAPLYTIRHPQNVAKLVLFAPGYKSLGFAEGLRVQADVIDTKVKVTTSSPSLAGWKRFGSREDLLVPGVFRIYREAFLATDPKSGQLGGAVRIPAGRLVDLLRSKPQFDASKISVPTLVIRGELDTFATHEDNQELYLALGSKEKKFVEIPNASHMIPYEKANVKFFEAVRAFLEAKPPPKKVQKKTQ
jgi:pimeloyl-ACP methyl ester carboxylesterase